MEAGKSRTPPKWIDNIISEQTIVESSATELEDSDSNPTLTNNFEEPNSEHESQSIEGESETPMVIRDKPQKKVTSKPRYSLRTKHSRPKRYQ